MSDGPSMLPTLSGEFGLSIEDVANRIAAEQAKLAKVRAQRDLLVSIVQKIAFAEHARAQAIAEAQRILANNAQQFGD